MVLHRHYYKMVDRRTEYTWAVVRLTDADAAFLILAGNDPRLYPGNPVRCKCPKIGKRLCKKCGGEGKYWYVSAMYDYIGLNGEVIDHG